ncbi:hypothetical protein JXL21_03715 [Candidatus Bathyarchaeota archaeon]|nr:hypothetical protein [Candidatus Bathyarchaeota archaeon]
MILKRKLMLLMLGVFLASTLVNVAFAADLSDPSLKGSFNALGSGYAIGRWPYSDGDVPIGTLVGVRASTTNMDATHVIFVWKADEAEIYRSGKIPLEDNGDTWGGDPVLDAYDSNMINVAGDWGVQAYFFDDVDEPFDDALGRDSCGIKAISFHPFVIPEVPFGTVMAVLAMLAALAFKRFI